MNQLLTATVACSMYWLGRYLERIEGTLFEIEKVYDIIIDTDNKAGVTLYKKFDIDLEYVSAIDFLDKSIRGEHTANLSEMMKNARENAIISRAYIDESVFGEIIALNDLFQKIQKSAMLIDYNDIDRALSLINEIWGAHAHRGHRQASDYFFKLGKLVEEVDFRLRFDREEKKTTVVLQEIDTIFKLLNPTLALIPLSEVKEDVLTSIYDTIDKMIIEE